MNVVRWALLFVLSSASALGACPEVPSSPYECKGRVLISNKEELQSYLSDFGLNSKKTFIRAAHLTGAFVDQSEGASLHLSTPCQITVLENTNLDIKGEVCLISGKNVIARSRLNLTTGTALLKAPNKVIIQDNFNGVISEELSLISTGVTLDSRAHIRHTSNVHATKLTLSALRRATLGHTSIYNVSGKVTLSSNGENLPSDIEEGISEWSSIWRDTQLNAGSLEIDGIDQVRVSSGVNITSPSVLLNGKSCRINKNSTITSDTKSGSCFSGLMPIAKIKITPNKEAVLNQSIFFDASRSHFNEGAKFIWTSYERSSGTESIIESKTTASPLTNFSFSTLGEKRIHLKIESLEGYYAELNREILIINSNPTPPVASLVATPIEGEVPFNITLDASASSDSDGTIVRYVFSDGTDVVESTNPTLAFIQEIPGTYNYTVEVTDNDGLKSSATAQVVAKPKTTNEESALLAYYKFNLIPTGGNTFNLELIFEGRSLNGKAITEAFYSTTNGDRLDVGRAILGHIDVIPVELDSPLELSLNVKDELGGVAVYTHTINSDSLTQAPLLSVDSIEYASNNMVFFSNLFHDPYGQLDGFANYQIDFGDGTTQDIQESSFQVTHAYPSSGDFLVKITAFGNNGGSFSVEETIAVSGEVNPFKFPLADFRVEKAPWAPGVRLYVDQSLSPNSPIKTYLWELGDGTTAFGREVIHFYQAGGYDVTLTAILEDGTQSVVKREIIIMNDASNIVSNLDCWDIGNLTLECEFSAADKFNDLSQFNIHFGDSEVLPENIISQSVSGGLKSASFTHTYQNSGNYTVSYQVISGRGEDLIKARDFSVTDAPGNLPPVADLSCFSFYDQVDCQAYGSFDPDGFITEYRFFYGNGDSEVTTTPQSFYRYSEVGTYEISLEVVDNFGTTSRVSQTVVIEERPNEFPVPQLACQQREIPTLDCSGAASYDVDGFVAQFRYWEPISGQEFITNDPNETVTFTFSESSLKEIFLEVTDNDNVKVVTSSLYSVDANIPPIANVSCIQSSSWQQRLVCNSTSLDSDGTISSFRINAGGREAINGPLEIVFDNYDTFPVEITATDNGGKSSTRIINIMLEDTAPSPNVDFTEEEDFIKINGRIHNLDRLIKYWSFTVNGDGPFKSYDGIFSYPKESANELNIEVEIVDFSDRRATRVYDLFTNQKNNFEIPSISISRPYGVGSPLVNFEVLKNPSNLSIQWEFGEQVLNGEVLNYELPNFGKFKINAYYFEGSIKKSLDSYEIFNRPTSVTLDQRLYFSGQKIQLSFLNISGLSEFISEVLIDNVPVEFDISGDVLSVRAPIDSGTYTLRINSISGPVEEVFTVEELELRDVDSQGLETFIGQLVPNDYDKNLNSRFSEELELMKEEFKSQFLALAPDDRLFSLGFFRLLDGVGNVYDSKGKTNELLDGSERLTFEQTSSYNLKSEFSLIPEAYAQEGVSGVPIKTMWTNSVEACEVLNDYQNYKRVYDTYSPIIRYTSIDDILSTLSEVDKESVQFLKSVARLYAKAKNIDTIPVVSEIKQILLNSPQLKTIETALNIIRLPAQVRINVSYVRMTKRLQQCSSNFLFPSPFDEKDKLEIGFREDKIDPENGRQVFQPDRYIAVKAPAYSYGNLLTNLSNDPSLESNYPELFFKFRESFDLHAKLGKSIGRIASAFNSCSDPDLIDVCLRDLTESFVTFLPGVSNADKDTINGLVFNPFDASFTPVDRMEVLLLDNFEITLDGADKALIRESIGGDKEGHKNLIYRLNNNLINRDVLASIQGVIQSGLISSNYGKFGKIFKNNILSGITNNVPILVKPLCPGNIGFRTHNNLDIPDENYPQTVPVGSFTSITGRVIIGKSVRVCDLSQIFGNESVNLQLEGNSNILDESIIDMRDADDHLILTINGLSLAGSSMIDNVFFETKKDVFIKNSILKKVENANAGTIGIKLSNNVFISDSEIRLSRDVLSGISNIKNGVYIDDSLLFNPDLDGLLDPIVEIDPTRDLGKLPIVLSRTSFVDEPGYIPLSKGVSIMGPITITDGQLLDLVTIRNTSKSVIDISGVQGKTFKRVEIYSEDEGGEELSLKVNNSTLGNMKIQMKPYDYPASISTKLPGVDPNLINIENVRFLSEGEDSLGLCDNSQSSLIGAGMSLKNINTVAAFCAQGRFIEVKNTNLDRSASVTGMGISLSNSIFDSVDFAGHLKVTDADFGTVNLTGSQMATYDFTDGALVNFHDVVFFGSKYSNKLGVNSLSFSDNNPLLIGVESKKITTTLSSVRLDQLNIQERSVYDAFASINSFRSSGTIKTSENKLANVHLPGGRVTGDVLDFNSLKSTENALPSDIEGVGITLENITTEGLVINADDSSLIKLYLGASLNENGGKDRFGVSGAKIKADGNSSNRILGNLGGYESGMDLSGLTPGATAELSVYYSKKLKLTGSGKFRVSNFDTDNLSLSSSGAGAEINYSCLRSSGSFGGSFSGFSDATVLSRFDAVTPEDFELINQKRDDLKSELTSCGPSKKVDFSGISSFKGCLITPEIKLLGGSSIVLNNPESEQTCLSSIRKISLSGGSRLVAGEVFGANADLTLISSWLTLSGKWSIPGNYIFSDIIIGCLPLEPGLYTPDLEEIECAEPIP